MEDRTRVSYRAKVVGKRLRLAWLALILIAILACQVIPTPPALQPTPVNWLTPQASSAGPGGQAATDTPVTPGATAPEEGGLAPGDVQPFPTPALGEFGGVEIPVWEMTPVLGDYALPVDWNLVANPEVTNGLTNSQRAYLARYGSLVIHSQEAQFASVRQEVAAQNGQPFYLTTDAAYHAMNQALGELSLALEREELRPRLLNLLRASLDQAAGYFPNAQGTVIEKDVWQAAATLAVALRLLDGSASLPEGMEEPVQAQIAQILNGGLHEASLFPGWQEDFNAYIPTGHYAGDPELDSYYRALTWLSRVNFPLDNRASGPALSRTPLVITLAMREAQMEDGTAAADAWAAVDGTLSFLTGPSLDIGPRETARLMDEIYGSGATLLDLADDELWKDFLSFSQALPPPKNNTEFLKGASAPPDEHNWRMFGRRFHLDEFILESLTFPQTGSLEKPRELPSGLDVMAALGSQAAMQASEAMGFTAYQNYPTQMNRLQSAAQAQGRDQWLNTVQGAWYYAFQPQLGAKGEAFPAYMRSPAWGYKELNSVLGSWAELRRDAAYFTAGSASEPAPRDMASGPAPAYVEPNPPVFYRLAYVAGAVPAGLRQRQMTGWRPAEAGSLSAALIELDDLSQQFKWLGSIAARELQGLPLTREETWLIQSPLGPAEQRLYQFQGSAAGAAPWEALPVMPVISSLPGQGERLQQVAVGLVDRLYVIIPQGGKLWVAQGGVYTYYEFAQPSQERLKDDVWQRLLASTTPALPAWADNFVFLDGYAFSVLAFRIGDVYRVTEFWRRLECAA